MKGKVSLRFSNIALLAKGRDEKGKARIWSIAEFNSKVKHVHARACEGDPFAAECMRLIESRLQSFERELVKHIDDTSALITRCAVQMMPETTADQVKAVIEVNSRYCPMGIKLVSLLKTFDDYYALRLIAARMGLIDYTQGVAGRSMHKKFMGIKNTPFDHYLDRGIRAHDEKLFNTMEWEQSVRTLRSTPRSITYQPRYFMKPTQQRVKAAAPVIAETSDHSNVSDRQVADTQASRENRQRPGSLVSGA